ncbi:MAG: hypothetical protein ACI9AT_002048 [Ulvibacter sp.]|jgi:hypothetical protein
MTRDNLPIVKTLENGMEIRLGDVLRPEKGRQVKAVFRQDKLVAHIVGVDMFFPLEEYIHNNSDLRVIGNINFVQ